MTSEKRAFLNGCVAMATVILMIGSLSPRDALGTQQAAAAPDPIPVVVLIFDEFPLTSLMNRHAFVDARLFPNFAALAEGSTWFRNTTTVAGFTPRAVPAIMTGRYPRRFPLTVDGVAGAGLFDLLAASHEVRSPDTFPGLCPRDLCGPKPVTTEQGQDSLGSFASGPRGRSLAVFLEMLGEKGPCLCVYHPIFPHSPWRYLPNGQRYGGTNPIPGQTELAGPGRAWVEDKWLVAQAYQRHLLQAAFTDRILGVILERMQELDRFEESILVVTADHGVAFRPGLPKRDVTPMNAGDIAAVPLFIKAPGQTEPVLSDVPAETIDITSSVMDLLGVEELAATQDGRSLFSTETQAARVRGIKPIRFSSEGIWQRSLRHKFAVFEGGGSSPQIFGVAPTSRHFLGAPVPSIVPASPMSVEIPNLTMYETAERDDSELPALIQGTVLGAPERGEHHLAIAVDDQIVAITRTYSAEEPNLFYAMLPPHIFKNSHRSFSFFVIDGGHLSALPVASSSGVSAD